MKEETDIEEAISYGVHILTAESRRHFTLISQIAQKLEKKVNVILRISSDNQFGMDPEDIFEIVSNRSDYDNVNLYGYHYYSGTQKRKIKQIESDIETIENVVNTCKDKYGFHPLLVEYGPGLAVDYFKENGEEEDIVLLNTVAPVIRGFAKRVPLGIEMGRFIVSSCGSYFTTVKDIKNNYGTQYAIVDGGIHHLKYFGQIMAMHTPIIVQETKRNGEKQKYCLCGSLCTVADVLAKNAELFEVQINDVLEFKKCGAYSLTESSSLFLSRDMPAVYLKENGSVKEVRGFVGSSEINSIGYKVIL
jgi:diaminopimelate decarboxylase